MRKARNTMFVTALILFILLMSFSNRFDEISFYYRHLKDTAFYIINSCVIMAFLLVGLSFQLAIIAKEKRYFKSGVNIAVAICIFAFIQFGLLEIRNEIEKGTEYFEFCSPDGKNSIVVTERQGFLGNGNITVFQRENRFFIQKRAFIQTLDRWSSPFSDQQYNIVWGDGQVTIRYFEGEWKDEVILLKHF